MSRVMKISNLAYSLDKPYYEVSPTYKLLIYLHNIWPHLPVQDYIYYLFINSVWIFSNEVTNTSNLHYSQWTYMCMNNKNMKSR
jgi:hypothetical protein